MRCRKSTVLPFRQAKGRTFVLRCTCEPVSPLIQSVPKSCSSQPSESSCNVRVQKAGQSLQSLSIALCDCGSCRTFLHLAETQRSWFPNVLVFIAAAWLWSFFLRTRPSHNVPKGSVNFRHLWGSKARESMGLVLVLLGILWIAVER